MRNTVTLVCVNRSGAFLTWGASSTREDADVTKGLSSARGGGGGGGEVAFAAGVGVGRGAIGAECRQKTKQKEDVTCMVTRLLTGGMS